MANAYGHRKCKSVVEVTPKATFDTHAHGNITRDGKMKSISSVKLVHTEASGAIVASNTINADVTVKGTLTADKIIGAVYA